MLSPDISFSLTIKAEAILTSLITCSYKTPSTRCLILSTFSSGSIWISDAPTCTASSNMDCNNFTTGASATSSEETRVLKSKSFSDNSSCNCSARLLISSVRRYNWSMATSRSDSLTTAVLIGFFRMRPISSSPNKSVGSAIANRTFSLFSRIMTLKRRARLSGSCLATSGSRWYWEMSRKGICNCRDRKLSRSVSVR